MVFIRRKYEGWIVLCLSIMIINVIGRFFIPSGKLYTILYLSKAMHGKGFSTFHSASRLLDILGFYYHFTHSIFAKMIQGNSKIILDSKIIKF